MKIKILFCLIIANIIFSNILHAVIDVSAGMPSSATLVGVGEIAMKIKDITTDVECSSITWSDQIMGSGWRLASKYVELSVSCNYGSWRVIMYSNNTTAETGCQRGGLLSTSTTTVRVPVSWVISDSKVSITNVGEPSEITTNVINGSTTTISASWKYMKDKGDTDDANTSAWNEQWDPGYASVLYGGPSYIDLAYGIYAVSPVVVYLEGSFSYIEGNMEYRSTIWFDLVY